MPNSRFYPPGFLASIFERRRLFERLNNVLTENRSVWISGPPGAGKTTLVAGYIRYCRNFCLWYQVDAADAEPAAFFQYLAAAADAVNPGTADSLPRLTPEYARGLPAFTRRFSEILFESLPSQCLLVFDNCQEFPVDSPVHALIDQVIGNARPDQHFIFVSREAPPPQLARLQVNRQMQMLGWDELKFTPEECDEFLGLGGGIDGAVAREIKDASNGWIAGLILMKKAGGSSRGNVAYTDHQLIFDYFAVEIVRHMPEDIYRLLLSAAIFKLFTPEMLGRLCGVDVSHVAEVLAGLHMRQFFMGRDQRDMPHYQLHPLFRHYLLAECRKKTGGDFLKLQQHAAAIVLNDGQLDAAAELMLECEDWEQLAGLCLANAQPLLQAGRHKSLLDWIEKLPPAMHEHNPWLSLWHGCAQIPYQPNRALEKFEQAYHGFKAGNDIMGRYMAWSFAVDCLNFAWESFTTAPFWLGEFQELQAIAPQLPPELEARVLTALLTLLIWAEGGVARFPDLIRRCYELLDRISDPSVEASLAGAILYFHSYVSADSEMSAALASKMHAKIVRGAAAPLFKLFWYAQFNLHCIHAGKYAEGEESMGQALRLLEDSGARVLEAALLCQGTWIYIFRKDLKTTDALLSRAKAVIVPERGIERLAYLWILADRHLLAEDLSAAQSALEEGYNLVVATGATLAQASLASTLCHSHQYRGESEQARPYLDFLQKVAARSGSRVCGLNALVYKCWFAKHAGDIEGYRRELQEALQYAIRNRIIIAPAYTHSVEELCRDALRYGIETDYVTEVIHKMQLRPGNEEDFYPDWPWRIRIETLGGLRIEVGGGVLTLSKKQKRVLELLMLLIVSHREPLPKERIKSVIWPEADPTKAEQNFRSTLTRLRKLLSYDAVLWKDGAVSLNKKIMWVDYWELESRLRGLHAGSGASREPVAESHNRTLELYRGRLLPGENHPWLLVYREQLHKKSCTAMLEEARKHLDRDDPGATISILNQALIVDPTVEVFYQLQMQALIRKGLYAEAVKSYQSCINILSSQLKILPSAETKKIFESIPRA